MTTKYLLILFPVLFFSCWQENKEKRESKISRLKTKDSSYFKRINSKSNEFFDSGQIDSVLAVDYLFLKEATKRGNYYYAGKASYNLASDYKHIGKLDSAFYYYNLSKNYNEKIRDYSQIGRRLLSMGIIQKNQADYFGAKETLTEAVKNLEKSDDNRFLASTYNELGTNNKKLLNYEEAIENYHKALSITKIRRDQLTYKNNLALVYQERGDYRKAIQLLQEILLDSILKPNSIQYARILHNLTYNKWKNGKVGIEKDFLLAVKIRAAKQDYRGLVSSYTNLAEFHVIDNTKKTKLYLDSLIFVSKKANMPEGEINALESYMKIEPKNVTHKDRYIFLKDSLYQQELKVKTQFAKMKYDDEQEKARLLALEAETAQKEAQLAKEGAQRTVLLSLLALLVMGGGSYYYFLRQRHKKKTLQEIYNTEKKISKKIHDGLANDVYGVMTAVQHQNGTPNEMILDQLEDIYQRTRDISHDTRELATGKDFGIELRDMLQGFSGNGTKVLIKGMEGIPWEKLNEHKSVALHRTLKELLVNMKKHSGAGLVALNFAAEKRRLKVDYSDNGIGVKKEQKQGVGLQNTENRIQSVGGKFIFGGTEGKGVKVTLTIPL
jgi:signal transduction histidine kinase